MIRQRKNWIFIGCVSLFGFSLIGCGGQGPSAKNGDNYGVAATYSDSSPNGALFRAGMMGGPMSLIDLSDDQKQQIQLIVQKFRLPRHNGGTRPSDSMRAQWKAHRDSLNNAIDAVLTPEQKALLDAVRAQLKAGVVPDTLIKIKVTRLTALLTLTPDQQTQAFAIFKQAMQQRLDAQKNDGAFTRDSLPGRNHAWHKGKNNGQGSFGLPAQFLNILTDQQKQILQQKKTGMHRGGEQGKMFDKKQ